MKRALLIFAAVVGLSGVALANSWYDDEVSGPANNAIILDTGALYSRDAATVVFVHSTLAGTFEFQLRDTDNTTVLHKQKFTVISGQADVTINGALLHIATDQHLVVVSKQALTLGTVSASIWIQ